MSPVPYRRAAALLSALLVAAASGPSPAGAHYHDEDAPGTSTEAAPAEAAPAGPDGAHQGAELSADGMPVNDASSFATEIGAPAIAPAVSLHSTAKIMNDAAVTNDLKAALKANSLEGPTPSIAPPPRDHLGAPAPGGVPSEGVKPAAAPADPIRFEVKPEAAGELSAAAEEGGGESAGRGGAGFGVALILLALAGLGGGFVLSRRLRNGGAGA